MRRPNLARTQRLSPKVEELTEHERPLDRRLDVDQPISVTRVQPREAVCGREPELSVPVVPRVERRPDPDTGGYAARLAVHKQRQVSVLVRDQRLVLLALDPVDAL